MTDKQNPKILLVDDEPVSIKILERILIREGYRIILADNGPKARKLASENKPDIILLDVMMFQSEIALQLGLVDNQSQALCEAFIVWENATEEPLDVAEFFGEAA